MNKPVAPGRIRWAILCLALAAGGALPATAGAGEAAVSAGGGTVTGELPIINGFAVELPAGALDELAGVDVARSSWSRSSWSTSWDK